MATPNPNPSPEGQTAPTTGAAKPTAQQTPLPQVPLNIQEMQLEIASLKKMLDEQKVAQTDADTQEQADGKEQNKEIEALTSQLKEVYVGIISGSKLYKAEELTKMEVNDLRSTAHTIQRMNQQLAKEGKNLPSDTQLGLPDNLEGNPPDGSTKIKEPFQYDPLTGTWKE